MLQHNLQGMQRLSSHCVGLSPGCIPTKGPIYSLVLPGFEMMSALSQVLVKHVGWAK